MRPARKNGPWAVTDRALITAAACSPEAAFDALLAGQGAAATPVPPVGSQAAIASFSIRDYVDRKGVDLLSRVSQLACAAASRLVAGLEGVPPNGVGVVLGSAWASLDAIVRFEREAALEGPRFVDPILFTETVANVPGGQVSIFFDWSAVNATVAAGSVSGLAAIEAACDLLEQDRASAVVAGGADELNPYLIETLAAVAEAEVGGRGPSVGRNDDPVFSEGACLVTLESASHARARGASILGFVAAAESRYVGRERMPQAAAAVLLQALDRARVERAAVDVVIGTAGDRWEEAVLAAAFGGNPPPHVAPRSVFGETWAASGPLCLVLATEMAARSRVPCRTSLDRPGPGLSRPVSRALVLDGSANGHVAAVLLTFETGR